MFSILQNICLFWWIENTGLLTETSKMALNRLIVITPKQERFLGKEAGVDRHRESGFSTS